MDEEGKDGQCHDDASNRGRGGLGAHSHGNRGASTARRACLRQRHRAELVAGPPQHLAAEPPKLTSPPGRKPLREGEGPAAVVAAWALPGGSSGDGEEEGRTRKGLDRWRRDRPPCHLGLGDAGAVSRCYVLHIILFYNSKM
jgi:hypothetical protein